MDATVIKLPSTPAPAPTPLKQARDALLDARAFFARRKGADARRMFDKMDRALAALPTDHS